MREKDSKSWSYADFLTLHRTALVSLPPYSDKWNTLDSTWARRFLQEVKAVSKDTVMVKYISIVGRRGLLASLYMFGRFMSQVMVRKLLGKSLHAFGAGPHHSRSAHQ